MKKSFFFLFVSVTSYNNAQTPVTSGPNWTVSRLTPSFNAFNFSTEITYRPDGSLWITERVEKNISGKYNQRNFFKALQ